ncbi:MAG: tyrosine-type recombinase/integrase [Actinomycetia bacterium]|nr:tyrosine-type recombinase/integrase [Actinomycetes bacterium]MCP4845532.1 tyrosine-type recombinase/integrase [Actinomycetes bacterium]
MVAIKWSPGCAGPKPAVWEPPTQRPGSLVVLEEVLDADLLAAWEARLRRNLEGYSDNTRKAYRSGLARFVTVVCEACEPDWACLRRSLTDLDRTAAAVEALRARWSPSTAGQTVAAVKSFCDVAAEQGFLDGLPSWPKTRHVVASDEDVEYFTLPEVQSLVAAAGMPVDDGSICGEISKRIRLPERDAELVRVLQTGMRIGEVLAMTRNWLRGEGPDRRLRIEGKGGRRRTLQIGANEALSAAFDRLLAWRNDVAHAQGSALGHADPLVVDRAGQPLNYQKMRRVFLAWLDVADQLHAEGQILVPVPRLPGGRALHAFRHTVGVEMAAAGVPINAIQSHLGHTNVATTGIYTRIAGEAAAAAVESIPVV